MTRLKQYNLTENTLVVFSLTTATTARAATIRISLTLTVHYAGMKRDLYEGGNYVPIAHWPGHQTRQRQ